MKSASTCSFATLGGLSRTSPSGKNETLAINLENVRYRRGRSPRDQCSGCPLTRPVLQKCPVLGTADIPGVCWCQDHAASHVQLDESTLGVGDGGAATQEMHSGVPRLPNPEVQGERRLQLPAASLGPPETCLLPSRGGTGRFSHPRLVDSSWELRLAGLGVTAWLAGRCPPAAETRARS